MVLPYTVLVLQFLAAQFVVGFVASAATANMSNQVNYWRRSTLRWLWALTGWLLLAALAWDGFQWVSG